MNNFSRKRSTTAFDAAFSRLNQAQKNAVNAIEGPVLVVAGPGTGKTEVLTMRIANILRLTDTKPSSILALTFTESAAQNMRIRLAALIGPDAYYVQISTFHAFCAQVIANHLEYFPLNPASQPITNLERYELLRSIVQELPLEAVKPLNSPLFHVRSLITNISAYKREGVTPDILRSLIEKQWQDPVEIKSRTERLKVTKRQQQLLEQILVYEQYQQRMRAAGRYDFDDMLALTVEVLSREKVLLQEYQEQYLYVLIDEYQDTNTVQNKVTRLLASFWGEQANVFAVGDPHQAIYRFQGASLENITQFVQWYPQAEIFTLTQGYRCPQAIYDVAHALIREDTSLALLDSVGESGVALKHALELVLQSGKHSDQPFTIVKAPDQTTSIIALVEKITLLLAAGTSPNEIAILYTKNKFAADIIPVLDKWSIPFYVEGGLNALDQIVVQQFITLCVVIIAVRQGGDVSSQLFELCTFPWFNIDRVTLFQLGRLAGKERRSMIELIRAEKEELSEAIGEAIQPSELEKMKQLLSLLEEWGALDFQTIFTSWLETVLHDSGLHDFLVAQSNDVLEPLLAMYSVFAFVKQLNTANQQFHLADFVRAMTTLQEQQVAIPMQSLTSADERVRLTTVHKAKGQEWENVFILHLNDGVWGNRRSPTSLPVPEHIVETASALARQTKELSNQDDRRLLYVGLTRAKSRVELWYEEQIEQDGTSRAQVPSLFLTEVQDRSEIVKTEAKMATAPAVVAARMIGPQPQSLDHYRLETYLTQLVGKFSLSITALNNYLRDPEKFFYQNILSLPTAKLPHLAYGTAIHSALELAGSTHLHSARPAKLEALLHRFDQALDRELLMDAERLRRRQRGHEVLEAYVGLQDFSKLQLWQTEYTVGYGSKAAFLDDMRLTGRIDRLDWNDSSHKTVCVVDYKTGKSKSRNEITMSTQTAVKGISQREQNLPEGIRGPYQRQLLYYKLLGQLDRSFSPEITIGTFDFVETASDKSNLVQHTFSLEQESVTALKGLIVEVMSEIRTLKFLDQLPENFYYRQDGIAK